MVKKAFSYIRMSTEAQLQGDSKRRQLEKSAKFAEEHGYELISSLEDIGISAFRGKNIREGELGRFRDAIERGEIDANDTVLLVESLDRLSRENVLDAFEELNKFLKTGISVITIADGQHYNRESLGSEAGKLFTAIGVMLRANEESQTKSDRLKESWKQKRSKLGERKLTAIAPAWLTLNKKENKFEGANGQPATTVRKIFDLCIDEGMGATSIAKHLNENIDKFPKFTKPKLQNRLPNGDHRTGWYDSYIKKILKNPAVYGQFQPHKMVEGKRVPDGEPIADYFPAIISKERFLLAQAKISERRRNGGGRHGRTFSNIFTKLIKCGECGATITYRNKGKAPKGGKYLRCHNAELHSNCSSLAWQYDQFEEAFFKFITEISFEDVFRKGVSKEKSFRDALQTVQQQIEDNNAALKQAMTHLSNPNFPKSALSDLYGEISSLKADLEDHYNKEKQLNSELAELESDNASKSQEELIKAFDKAIHSEIQGSDERKDFRRRINTFIKSVVKEITLNNRLEYIAPWEVIDIVPKQLLSDLQQRGILSINPEILEDGVNREAHTDDLNRIEQYFESQHGQRVIHESRREFTVTFKNGVVKHVHPFEDFSHIAVSKEMINIMNNSKR